MTSLLFNFRKWQSLPLRGRDALNIGSLSRDVFERRMSTGSGLFHNTKREEASLPLDARRPKTPYLNSQLSLSTQRAKYFLSFLVQNSMNLVDNSEIETLRKECEVATKKCKEAQEKYFAESDRLKAIIDEQEGMFGFPKWAVGFTRLVSLASVFVSSRNVEEHCVTIQKRLRERLLRDSSRRIWLPLKACMGGCVFIAPDVLRYHFIIIIIIY